MATAEQTKVNLTSVLLSVIAGLLTFFGSVSVNYLSKMSEGIDLLRTNDAVQDNKLYTLGRDQDEMKDFYQNVIKEYAKKEETVSIKAPK